MGNPARFRILSVTSLAAWLGMLVFAPPSHANPDCEEKVRQARERFRAAALPDQRQAEQWCINSRRAAFDRSQSRSECLQAWTDLREARDNYLGTLKQGCHATEQGARDCRNEGNQAEAQACLEKMTAKAAGAEAHARSVLDAALARVDEIREKFNRRYEELSNDHYFLESNKNPNDPGLAAITPRAREFGARTLRDYGTQAKLVSHEQQLISNAALLFREAAAAENANRLEAERTLSTASQEAGKRATSLGEARKESTITGRTDSSGPMPSAQPMMPPQGPPGGQGGTADNKNGSGKAGAVSPASAQAVPGNNPPDRQLASVSRPYRGNAARTDDGISFNKAGNETDKPDSGDSGRPVPSSAAISRRGGSAIGGNGGGEGSLVAGKPAAGAPSPSEGAGRSAPGRARKDPGGPHTSRDAEETTSAQLVPAGAGTSLLDAPLGMQSLGGQLGPSEMVMKEEGELTPEQLLGLGDLKGDAPLTAEEMALLGLDPGGSPAEGKAARATLSAQLRALSHSGAVQSGIGSVDSVGIFLRVRHLHVRAQKKGLVMHLRKKL